jgi:type 1 fimbria pilin
MDTRNVKRSRRLATVPFLLASAYTAPAFAAGCNFHNLAIYQIGQTTYVDVSNDVPLDAVVREGAAPGEGKLLLTCQAGLATFRGRWEDGGTSLIHPLTVGGVPSGFGMKLSLEDSGGAGRSIPHDFDQRFADGDEVRSDQDTVRYQIVRTPGPVAFGKVDPGRIAQSSVTRPNGSLVVFRAMEIYELIFRRPSCSISAETLNQTVSMGRYNLRDFNNADRATPWVPFKLTVSECKEPVGLVARFTFGSTGDADEFASDLFSMPAGGPTHVGLQIANEARRSIEPGKSYDANALATGESFQFNVRLRESRYSVGGGTFTRPVTVRVDFM